MATLQNNMVFQFQGTMLTSDTSVNISNDLERNLEVSFTDAYVEIKNRKGNKVERVKASATGGVLTCSKRGLDQSDTDTEVSGLKQQWNEGTIAYVTILSSQLVDKQSSNTYSSGTTQTMPDIRFSGTTTSGLRVKSLTTTQRLALTPVNGDVVYDSTIGVLYQYIGGARSTFASGTTVNADTTTAGKVEISIQTETEDQTATGGSGATIVPTNATINPNNITSATPATGDKLAFADISNSNKLRSATLQTLVDTARPLATDAEAHTGTGTTQAITPKQLKTYYGPAPVGGILITDASSTTLVTVTGTTATKKYQFTIPRTGTYTIQFNLTRLEATGIALGRVYKNGVAFGTSRNSSSTSPSYDSYSEDLAFTELDTVEVWINHNTAGQVAQSNSFSVSHSLAQGTVTTF